MKEESTYAVAYVIFLCGAWFQIVKKLLLMVKDWIVEHILGHSLTDKLVQLKRKQRNR